MANTTQIRTFEIVAPITGWLDGDINDWPAGIQDVIYMALDIKAQEVELPLKIVMSKCDIDHDIPAGFAGHFFVHVVASEIVIADQRTLLPNTVVDAKTGLPRFLI